MDSITKFVGLDVSKETMAVAVAERGSGPRVSRLMSRAVSRVKRAQVYLDPVEHEAFSRKAAEEGVSMSELLRRIVRGQLGFGNPRGSPAERLVRLVGIGEGGLSDVSERHDEYLARALHREMETETPR